MASIDPTGLDLADAKAVRARMAYLKTDVRLVACGVSAAEDALLAAFDRLMQRDPALYHETLLTHLRMYVADFVETPRAPVLEERRRWRQLRDALEREVRDSCGDYVTRSDEEE